VNDLVSVFLFLGGSIVVVRIVVEIIRRG